MTDDVEARLRAALHAYAEQVDDADAELPRVPAVEKGRTLRRWREALLVAAAVVAVIGGAWWVAASGPGGDVVAGSSAGASPEVATDAAAPSETDGANDARVLSVPDGSVAALPAAPEVGVPYAFDFYTHCGVLGADVAGTWFAADPPLVHEYGPPPGWGNPYQPGTLTLNSRDDAVFTDDLRHRVLLRAAPDSARPPLCD